jgi:DNA-binding MarR family transcriptional regulator
VKVSAEQVERYVSTAMHVPLKLTPWGGASRLPVFLRGRYRMYAGQVLGRDVLFLLGADDLTAGSAEKHMRALHDRWANPVVFVIGRITPRLRMRLIHAGIPFVVPGTQLYLPVLGMDLRERFKPRSPTMRHLSPSTQTILLGALLNRPGAVDAPGRLATRLGYSAMTTGRALDQLEEAGLITVRRVGRERSFTLAGRPLRIWEEAQPILTSPVKRLLWLAGPPGAPVIAGAVSGLEALAEYSSLAPPSVPIRALSTRELEEQSISEALADVDSPEEADVEVEVWSYSPRLLAEGALVDRLSLYLLLKEDGDERVQSAVEEMMQGVPW